MTDFLKMVVVFFGLGGCFTILCGLGLAVREILGDAVFESEPNERVVRAGLNAAAFGAAVAGGACFVLDALGAWG